MYQIPLMDFTKEFNARTADFEKGIPFNVKITKVTTTISSLDAYRLLFFFLSIRP